MNANPSTCPHLNLIYEKVAGGDPFIRCDDCMTTWDADEPIADGDWPRAKHEGPWNVADATEHYDITAEDYPADYDTRVCTHSIGTDWHAQEPPLTFCKTCGLWYDATILNSDNEPTSEHQQWRRDNDDA